MDYKVGQRWVSHAEAQLGLGIVVDIDGRRVTLAFPAVEEERTYAMDNAPLTRIRFNVGEMLHVVDGQALEVTAVSEQAGLLVYTAEDADGNRHQVPELRLSSQLILTTPPQRLFSGQFDRNSAFALRVASLTHRARLQQSQVQGLLGARTSLLPHQIHIAAEVAGRHAPRVLLADEVGLGKTIEAGMILHAQLHSGRARRVLILVPDSLLHQWLVEMLRRFNLSFALFDAQRFDAQRETDPEANPFDTEQRVLCSLSQLVARDDMHAAALAAGWDLMVVDEAHHLHWSETAASPAYLAVEALARKTHGLLLLTATPEQVGVESHFARLRLLDPARFHDLAAFRAEEAAWQPLNTLVQRILEGEGPLEPALEADLQPWLGDDLTQAGHDRARIIRQLLDRHGTGRVLFRNTRAAIKGFPARQLHRYGLPAPDLYAGQQALFPEQMHASEAWLAADPRVVWLEKKLIALRPHKVLVICAHASTALALESHLQLRAGIRSAAFHEGLTLIERDRAAAWFADTEQGAQALVCSEIGSEGRNFQFAHHLVLFDLPRNPDLLEQRIGRLDRIGQTDTIEIHVPYLEDSPQAVLQRWFHDGLNAFEQSCAVGMAVDEAVGEALDQQLASPDNGLEALIERTRTLAEQARQALQTGRDPLLELNSCDRPRAEALIETIEAEEDSDTLEYFMTQVFEEYGVAHEEHSLRTLILRPSEHLREAHFPGLDEDGTTVTFDRQRALSREDIAFLSWEHPMVVDSMDMIQSTELGNATLASMAIKGVNPGTVLLEAVYAVHCPAPRELQLTRYLPARPVRVLVDMQGRNLADKLDHERLNSLCEDIRRRTGPAIIAQVREVLESMLQRAERHAAETLPTQLGEANAALEAALGEEVQRLEALRRVNPSIREEEIRFFRQQMQHGREALGRAALQLQAMRVIVTT